MNYKQELEHRISQFKIDCDSAIEKILQLKKIANSFLDDWPQGKAEVKERYLTSSRHLNEFNYHIMELNLVLSGIGADIDLETPSVNKPLTQSSVLSNEYITRTSARDISDKSETQTKRTNDEQRQYTEQTPLTNQEASRREIESKMVSREDLVGPSASDPVLTLPPQVGLAPGSTFQATLIYVDGTNLGLIENADEFYKMTEEMTEYYKQHHDIYNSDLLDFIQYYVYYDEDDTKSYLRALLKKKADTNADIYLVDTGECLRASMSVLRPLEPQFCATPPLARRCHLADVRFPKDENTRERLTEFLSQYLVQQFTVQLADEQDNEYTESHGVYLYLDDENTLNDKLMQEFLLESNTAQNHDVISKHSQHIEDQESQQGMCELIESQESIDLDDALDYANDQEYENPVEAVTGYDNRDEMDICRHYKGGDGCFKGARCKKRHVHILPDGYTLDRVPIVAKCRPAALPAPGTWHKVKVTHVVDVSRFYVHIEHGDEPMTLADLVEDMTRVCAKAGRLKLEPALGELVSARFTDGRWYRAKVTGFTDEGKKQVTYIDFGNDSEVSDSDMRPLEERWLSQPIQAVACRLAGARAASDNTSVFTDIVLDNIMRARVISRSYDELTVELFDLEDFNVAEQLSLITGTPLEPYEVVDDSRRLFLHVPA